MKVLHILNELKPSGAEAMLSAAGPYWRRQGLQNDILCTGENVGTYARTLERSGYKIYHIPFSPSFGFLLSIYRCVCKYRYDVIHIHPERGNFWYAVAAYASGNRRVIRTVHNVFPFKAALRVERIIQRWVMRRMLGVKTISIGPSVKNTEWRTFRNPSLLIPNWFDSTRFVPPSKVARSAARRALGIADEDIIITSIGGCWSYKNHASIIEAMGKVPREARVLYVHVGQEGEGYPERKLAERIGASARVRFLGIVPDILPILHASDVYIMPSLYEGFGVAAVEAMGAGLPAILSDVPGLCDFRDVCKQIYWVEPTCESVKEAVMHFLDSPPLEVQDIGLKLSSAVHRHFGIETGAGTYARVYKSLNESEG